MDLQTWANILQIVGVLWVLILGSKTIVDLLKTISRVKTLHRWGLAIGTLLILSILWFAGYLFSPAISLSWFSFCSISITVIILLLIYKKVEEEFKIKSRIYQVVFCLIGVTFGLIVAGFFRHASGLGTLLACSFVGAVIGFSIAHALAYLMVSTEKAREVKREAILLYRTTREELIREEKEKKARNQSN